MIEKKIAVKKKGYYKVPIIDTETVGFLGTMKKLGRSIYHYYTVKKLLWHLAMSIFFFYMACVQVKELIYLLNDN